MEKKKKKAHQFSFKKEGEDLFDDNSKTTNKSQGRPKKNIEKRFTKQYTLQLRDSDDQRLKEAYSKEGANVW
jgi:hypothetical protein